MKIERTKNATRGIIFGSILRLYQMLIPFLMRTIMIYFMGVKYLGLTGLFASILQVLNLAELGIGNAMVFSMYKPIAEDDNETICALMNLYKKYYRIIGLIIGSVGLILTPFIPKLISGSLPTELNIYILYFMNLSSTVLTYWLFAYKNCLLQAHQRVDIVSILTIITNSIQYGIQFFVIIYLKNYYLYVLVIIVTQILNNIITAYVVDKMYPQYKPIGTMDKQFIKKINARIKDLFTGKIGGVILNSVDTIVISAFLGLKILATYQNYYFILTAIIGLVETILQSMTAGLGNSFIIESKEKNYKDLKKFTFMFCWLIGFCTCCFLCLYQPFMKLWVGEKMMLNFFAVICFCIYFYTYEINRFINIFKDAAGLWHEDRFRPLTAAIVNLVCNLIMIRFWGIYGVLFSTVISLLGIEIPWLLYNMFTIFFDRSFAMEYIIQLVKYTAIVIINGKITLLICNLFSGDDLVILLLRLCICIILSNLLFLFIYLKNPYFKESLQLVDKITKNKLQLEKKYIKLNKFIKI